MSKSENLKRFFQKDGRTVILPIDHGGAIPVHGLEKPAALIEATRDSVDGYVVNYGVAKACRDALQGKGVCVRTDCYKPVFGDNPDEGPSRLYTADDAFAVGGNATMNMCYVHHPHEASNFRECAALISECEELDMPVILEALPFGIGRPDDYTVENIGFTVRLAAELGADVVKTAYPTNGGVDDFRAIVDAALVPVVVLGGAAMGDDAALLGLVRNAMDAGASGIAVGRNVWQHANPAAMAAALSSIVHDDASVDAAMKLVS